MLTFFRLIKALLNHSHAWDVPSHRMAQYLRELDHKPKDVQDVRRIWRRNLEGGYHDR